MSRTARALSVAALAGAVLGTAAPAALADPAAEVSPGAVAPGGSVTVSVSCDPVDGTAPAAIEAVSQAFEEGTVELKRVAGNDEKAAGPAYHGTARVPPAENFEGDPDAAGPESEWTVDGTCPAAGGKEGKEWSATFTVARDSGASGGGKSGEGGEGSSETGVEDGLGEAGDVGGGGLGSGEGWTGGGTGGTGGTGGGGRTGGGGHTCAEPRSDRTGSGKSESHSGKSEGDGAVGEEGLGEGGVGGQAEGGTAEGDRTESDPGTTGAEETAPEADAADPYWYGSGPGSGTGESRSQDCGDAADQHGVQAGTGGTFTDSVPALVAGGLLIAGAFGGAVYRVRRRTPTVDD
ncbi:hypothetical protein [Streptomyces sp. NPDC098781]|uniref:hypothetical protein n=1 Tax=Streptomyces sp. NPDC098781 TaxID=3366097 RepID=UPI0037FD9185